ncbi:dedicator of cytokinesis protein 9 isoform X2 [Neocloeon triangulifer]|uniref:dedicator of cytokinesis protein 9 isoform X2 n=1 Tax=Neocloeon triangulifer TaxID=2078957 RepID=UPI00286FA6B4|nr:dedicator of cytokinesis protein 9 isoform X2 [Neocloeon triangulifer]
MSERKFARALKKPGMAAHLRETMSQVVRETSSHSSAPELVTPIEYEAFILKNKTLLQNDPQRELLLYPSDDVSQVILPRKFRTVLPPLPGCVVAGEDQLAKLAQSPLLARESLRSYNTNWNLVHFKYSSHAGTYHDLPKTTKPEELREEVYEIDADIDAGDESSDRSIDITKQGILLKGPESGQERIFVNLASKTFKRRYCYLKREVDGTYILEMQKPEKRGDPKSDFVMDFCTEVVKNPKRGRFAFELKFAGSSSGSGTKVVCFAAETEAEMNDWVAALSLIVAQNKQNDDKKLTERESVASPSPHTWSFGTLKGLENSMIPELVRYSRETDSSIAAARQDNRRRLFAVCPHLPESVAKKESLDATAEPYREQFGLRLLVKCEGFSLKLHSQLGDENISQIEPYFLILALFDAKDNRKLTEDIHFDVNSDEAKAMLVQNGEENGTKENGVESFYPPEWNNIPHSYLENLHQAILSVTNPHPDVYLVLRVEKVLQGAINQSTEPYIRPGRDSKIAQKALKVAKLCCQKLGKYRMPFAWAARPLFRHTSGQLDMSAQFSSLYRQEPNKLNDEELLKMLQDFKKPDKMSRLTTIPATVNINVTFITDPPENSLTTSLAPIKPFNPSSETAASIEVVEFENHLATGTPGRQPYSVPCHHLYVYPKQLCFEAQKVFAKARNLACTVELRDSDAEDTQAIKCIYQIPGSDLLVDQFVCPVLHHNRSPSWYSEVKLRLPVCLSPTHHLLFRFHHITCDANKKTSLGGSNSSPGLESSVGYAWLPLSTDGRIETGDKDLAIAASLPDGYLAVKPLGLGKGYAGPEITWLDGHKSLFRVGLRLVSTLATTDGHLHNMFVQAEKLLEPKPVQLPPNELETSKVLKAGHAIHISTLLNFLPTILNLLFNLLAKCGNVGTVGIDTMRLLLHIVTQTKDAGRHDALVAYVKYVYGSSHAGDSNQPLHEQLAVHMPALLDSIAATEIHLALQLMSHSGFFLEILAKSMAQHLLVTGRIKMLRNERFSADFTLSLGQMLDSLAPCVIANFKDHKPEAQELNTSIALFLKRCLSLMDRGVVLGMVGRYSHRFNTSEHAMLSEYKYSFLGTVCCHEHFIPLNIPLAPPPLSPNNGQNWSAGQLNEDFCKQHFLAALMLREVQHALNKEVYQVRRAAVRTLRDLMAKHELDSRYQNKGQLARIASLYLPWLEIAIDNRDRLPIVLSRSRVGTKSTNVASSIADSNLGGSSSILSAASCPQNGFRDRSNRNTLHFDSCGSPFFSGAQSRENVGFSAIAGQGVVIAGSNVSLESDDSTMSIDAASAISQETAIAKGPGSIGRMMLNNSPQPNLRHRDMLQASEAQDILLCYLFVVKHIGDQCLVAYWQHCSQSQLLGFFQLLHMSLLKFQYQGKRHQSGGLSSKLSLASAPIPVTNGFKSRKANTLPARMEAPAFGASEQSFIDDQPSPISETKSWKLSRTVSQQTLLEANMAAEIALVVLDCVGLYCRQCRDSILAAEDSPITEKIFEMYLTFLQVSQCESILMHVFAALRAFVNNFSPVLFQGSAKICGLLCSELLRCCNSKLSKTRQESCAIIYLLMRSNFEYTGRQGLTRMHLQLVISVSRLLGNMDVLNNSRMQESLSMINNFASSDKAMKTTRFPKEVRSLTTRMRNVLMATAQMREHNHEPEVLNELQLNLADSYSCTPELRMTWLQALAGNHSKANSYSEAALCHLHMAALQAEYLKQKGLLSWGAEAFSAISPNITEDEKNLKVDTGAAETQYTEVSLTEQLTHCSDLLERAERYELQVPLYRLIIPLYEGRRDYNAMAAAFRHLAQSCTKASECATRSGRRLLGTYYRVAYYGQACFDENTQGVEYIYKEPKVTSLAELSERLTHQFASKFGPGAVKIVCDVDRTGSDKKDDSGWVLVTHVTPYWEPSELGSKLTLFERTHHNVKHFMFDTPFTKNGPAQGGPSEQWKRRTILTTSKSFPYLVRRLPVVERKVMELNPLIVALHEMKQRLSDLEEVVYCNPPDAKRLQLLLQGSVCVQVNAGPMAYASAFLDPSKNSDYPEDDLEQLRDVFREFVSVCSDALHVNAKLVSSEQQDYQEMLSETFQKMCQDLGALMSEPIFSEEDLAAKRQSCALFSAISGLQNDSSFS